MGYSKPDPYYQPETFGLVPVGELDDPQGSWVFDLLVVWNHPESNVLYWHTDTGCPCPEPFDVFHELTDLTEVPYDDAEALADLESAIRNHCLYENDQIARTRVNLLEDVRRITGS